MTLLLLVAVVAVFVFDYLLLTAILSDFLSPLLILLLPVLLAVPVFIHRLSPPPYMSPNMHLPHPPPHHPYHPEAVSHRAGRRARRPASKENKHEHRV